MVTPVLSITHSLPTRCVAWVAKFLLWSTETLGPTHRTRSTCPEALSHMFWTCWQHKVPKGKASRALTLRKVYRVGNPKRVLVVSKTEG